MNLKSEFLIFKIVKIKFKLYCIWDSIQDTRFETLLFDSPAIGYEYLSMSQLWYGDAHVFGYVCNPNM